MQVNPQGENEGWFRVCRGSSWQWAIRLASRDWQSSEKIFRDVGFRFVFRGKKSVCSRCKN